MSGFKYEHTWAQIGKDKIWEDNEVKLLGVAIDNGLNFDTHINSICKKANQKLSVLSRMRCILNFQQKRIIFKSFFEAKFKYCPLIWMFCSRKANNRINKLHEQALRIVYDDDISSFEQLLEQDDSFTIHHQNIQTMAMEMYKIKHGLSANCFNNIFVNIDDDMYNLRSGCDFRVPSVNTENCGKNS